MKNTEEINLNNCIHLAINASQGWTWCDLQQPNFFDHCKNCKKYEATVIKVTSNSTKP